MVAPVFPHGSDTGFGPFVMVIFGATGDLTNAKLMPALFDLYKKRGISKETFVIGVARRELGNDEFRELMRQAVQRADPGGFDLNLWGEFADGIYYESGYFEDPGLYDKIVMRLRRFDEALSACVPRFFYLATPPSHYGQILDHLESSKLAEGCGHGSEKYTRVCIEKPFGNDLDTARALEKKLTGIFSEKQVYRIDHYLGKETVQNIMAFRFANGIFEPTWNREFIDHVQITLSETAGVSTRGKLYEGLGALRDVVQNHMLEMLALVAMEQPAAFDAASIRKRRVEALKSVVCIGSEAVPKAVVRAQYTKGAEHSGYREESGIPPDSGTETFVALKVEVDSPRFRGVPFYLRTGKRLPKKSTEISLHYKKPAVCFGDRCLFDPDSVNRNVLRIRIEPEEGVDLRLMSKLPGFDMSLAPTRMVFKYSHDFVSGKGPEAYARLLLDAIRGDQTLFAHADGIDANWKLMNRIREGWERYNPPLFMYQAGTWGPEAAIKLIEQDGRHWYVNG